MTVAAGPRRISRARSLRGAPCVPGDKSISHRALVLGALAEGATEVVGILDSDDVRSTERCLRALGVPIRREGRVLRIDGAGARGFGAPAGPLDCGNSGTTMRTLIGTLAGRTSARLTGDASLSRRPMSRVADPLRAMGARVELTRGDFAPVAVEVASLRAIDWSLPVASAQVKTALLLAALSAEGTTRLSGKIGSRDHTERMLRDFGADVAVSAREISLRGRQRLRGCRVEVPGDPSSSAYWIAAASLVPDARVEIEGVSLNPTRIGVLRVMERMGARIRVELGSPGEEKTDMLAAARMEPSGRVEARHAALRGTRIAPEEVPSLVDELPLFAVVATQAAGLSVVHGAEELRVKETDRLAAIAAGIRALGGRIEIRPDGFAVEGPQRLHGGHVRSFGDHRIAMALAVAALVSDGETALHDPACVSVSYPAFFDTLEELVR